MALGGLSAGAFVAFAIWRRGETPIVTAPSPMAQTDLPVSSGSADHDAAVPSDKRAETPPVAKKADASPVEPEATGSVSAPAPAKAAAAWSAAGMEAKLNLGAGEVTLWTDEALDGAAVRFALAVIPSQDPPAGASWQPLARLRGRNDGRDVAKDVEGSEGFRAQSLEIPLSAFSLEPAEASSLVLRELVLSVRSGARIVLDGTAKDVFANDETLIRLRSIKDLRPSQVAVFWSRAEGREGFAGQWTRQESTLKLRGSGALRLSLRNPTDLARLWPLVSSSKTVAFAPLNFPMEAIGMNFVLGNAVIASLGIGANEATAVVIARLLGSDLSFRGRTDAFILRPEGHDDAIVQWLARGDAASAAGDGGQDVVVYNGVAGDKFYNVKRAFIRAESSARSYLARTASALFAEKVDILAGETGKAVAH